MKLRELSRKILSRKRLEKTNDISNRAPEELCEIVENIGVKHYSAILEYRKIIDVWWKNASDEDKLLYYDILRDKLFNTESCINDSSNFLYYFTHGNQFETEGDARYRDARLKEMEDIVRRYEEE